MIHIISLSSGLSSFLAGERVIQRYGAENCLDVFADTQIEDEDNYRFLAGVRQRWSSVYGMRSDQHITIADGRTPMQVFEDHHIIPNQKIAPCTFELKIAQFEKFTSQFMDMHRYHPQAIIHIGYDWTEIHRCYATSKNYNRRGFIVDYPLLWKPYELRDYTTVTRSLGIEPPQMYADGYTHANCGGACVKQGIGDWIRTLITRPHIYAAYEEWERKMRDHPTRKDYAILRDQSGGTVTPLTLMDLRERYEAGNAQQIGMFDSQVNCVVCGFGY